MEASDEQRDGLAAHSMDQPSSQQPPCFRIANYKRLYNVLCRGKRSRTTYFRCKICGTERVAHEYLKHQRAHRTDRCLICEKLLTVEGEVSVDQVCAHITGCLYPDQRSLARSSRDCGNSVLCRKKQYACLRNIFLRMNGDWRFRCDFCETEGVPVTEYLRHQSSDVCHDRDACLVCSVSLAQLNFSRVYTHLMCCLLPDGVEPTDRRNVRVDREYLRQCRHAKLRRGSTDDSAIVEIVGGSSCGEEQQLVDVPPSQHLIDTLTHELSRSSDDTSLSSSSSSSSSGKSLAGPLVFAENHRCYRTVEKFSLSPNVLCADRGFRLLPTVSGVVPALSDPTGSGGTGSGGVVVARNRFIGAFPADQLNGLNCLTCDHQRARYERLRDRWPDDGNVRPGFEWPADSILAGFLSNDRFRQQYSRLPDWLLEAMTADQREEYLDFETTGISTLMANALWSAFQHEDFVLRHIYLYDYAAIQSLTSLFEHPDRYYVFPYTCLCSALCFEAYSDASLLPHVQLKNQQADRRDDDANDDGDLLHRVLTGLVEKFAPASSAIEEQPPSSSDAVVATASSCSRSKNFSAKTRRHYSKFLEYLQKQLCETDRLHAYRRRLLHRHVLVCFRNGGDAAEFCRAACRHFRTLTSESFSAGANRIWFQRMQESYPVAVSYMMRPRSHYSVGGHHDFSNVTHLVQTLVSLGTPSTTVCRIDRSFSNFSERLNRLDDLLLRYRRICRVHGDTATSAVALFEQFIDQLISHDSTSFDRGSNNNQRNGNTTIDTSRYRLQTCVSNPTNATLGHRLHRLGRFYLYDERARNTRLTPLQRYKLFCEFCAQPMGWEENHFYIAVPVIAHAFHLFSLIIPGGIACNVNRTFVRSLRQPNQLLSLVSHLFEGSRGLPYTRLGYVLNRLFGSWPVDHLIPVVRNYANITLIANGDTCVRFRRQASLDEDVVPLDPLTDWIPAEFFAIYGSMLQLRVSLELNTLIALTDRLEQLERRGAGGTVIRRLEHTGATSRPEKTDPHVLVSILRTVALRLFASATTTDPSSRDQTLRINNGTTVDCAE